MPATHPTPFPPHPAHGPGKAWENLGISCTINVTAPTDLVRRAREAHLNLSRLFQEALEVAINGGQSPLATGIEADLKVAEERVLSLKIALKDAQARDAEIKAQTIKRAPLDRELDAAVPFWHNREQLDFAANLGWAEPRAKRAGVSPTDFLQLLMERAAKKK